MLVMMRLCPPRSRQLLLTSCLLGHKATTARRLLLNNPCCWNRTFTRNAGIEEPPKHPKKVKAEAKGERTEKVSQRAETVKSQISARVWSDEQLRKLEELVAEHTIKPEYSKSLQGMTKRATDWATIGRLLAVDPEECKAMWKSIQDRGKKTGRFTAEEDALIAQRVAEWGDKGPGLWASLGREMGRDSGTISIRYRTVIVYDRSFAPTSWTSDMDARLREGVALHKEKDGWAGVALYVGGGVTALQCQQRWNHYLGHVQQEGIKLGDWSDEEMRKLEELVPEHVIKPYWSERYEVMTKERIEWTVIGRYLNRIPQQCRNKWSSTQASRMKQGPFTAEEDALIRQRVAEWEKQGKPKGLWVSLQKETGRPLMTVRMRWTSVLATRELDWVPKESWEEQTFTPLLEREKSDFEWSLEMDIRLKEGVPMHKEKEGWVGVANYVGDSVTAAQCRSRWHQHVSKVQKEGIRRGGWSEGEVRKLEELVPQHVIKPYWSEQCKVTTKECIEWTVIGKQLNRIPKACKKKWNNILSSRMKRGPFTAEEDALIRQRVAEWGNKGSGLWVSLEKELGRPAEHISSRWRLCLIKKRLNLNNMM